MITRVVFEFSTSTRGGPVPQRIIAAPALRGVLAFQRWRGPVEPTTGMPPEGPAAAAVARGRWEQDELRDAPPELLMALAGLLAGAPQSGKPMFMETRVETHHIGDNERGETLIIKLGRITGEPFEAALPGALLGGGRDARALVSLAAALGVVQDIKAPGWTDAIHDACIKAIGDLKQRSDAARDAAILREIAERLGVSIPPCSADEWSMKARQTIIDALPAHELAKRNAQAAAERIKYLEAKLPPSQRVPDPGPCTEHAHHYLSGFATCQCGQATRTGDCRGWKVEGRSIQHQIRQAADDVVALSTGLLETRAADILRPYAQDAALNLPAMAGRVVARLKTAGDMIDDIALQLRAAMVPEGEGAVRWSIDQRVRWLTTELAATKQREIWATDALREVADRLGVIAPGGPEWLKIIRDQCVAKYEAALKAEGLAVDELRMADKTIAKGNACAQDFYEVCEALDIEPAPEGTFYFPGWSRTMRDGCIKAIGALKETAEAQKKNADGATCLLSRIRSARLAFSLDPGGPEDPAEGMKVIESWIDAWVKDHIFDDYDVTVFRKHIEMTSEILQPYLNGDARMLPGMAKAVVQQLDAARKSEGLAVDALRTVSEAFGAVREHMGAPFIPSGPGWAEQTRDACAVIFNQVKADLAAARSDVLGLTKQVDVIMTVGAATYAHEALTKALGYAPGTVSWSRCLELVRETITQRNEARQEAASLASKMFDARKEVDGLRKARAYERNALHQVARALSVAPEADSTDTMDDCLKAIDRMRHLRMDAEAENRGLREANPVERDGRRRAEAALDAIRDHLGIRREGLSSPWVDSAKDQIIRAIDGLKEIDRKAADSAVAATEETIRARLVAAAMTPGSNMPLEHVIANIERAAQRLRDESAARPARRTIVPLESIAEALVHDLKFLTGAHDQLDRSNTEIRKMVGADSMPMTDTVTAVREALAKGAGNAAIVAAIDRLTTSLAEGHAMFKRLHESSQCNAQNNVPAQEREQIADVWALIAQPDGYGSPYWTEPHLDDTTPAQAVSAVLAHLRKAVSTGVHSRALVCAIGETLGLKSGWTVDDLLDRMRKIQE